MGIVAGKGEGKDYSNIAVLLKFNEYEKDEAAKINFPVKLGNYWYCNGKSRREFANLWHDYDLLMKLPLQYVSTSTQFDVII